MITPQKHMNLDTSVIRVAALIIKQVAKRRSVELEVIKRQIIKRTGTDGELVLLPALNFLFLLDKIAYHPKNDTLEYKDG